MHLDSALQALDKLAYGDKPCTTLQSHGFNGFVKYNMKDGVLIRELSPHATTAAARFASEDRPRPFAQRCAQLIARNPSPAVVQFA